MTTPILVAVLTLGPFFGLIVGGLVAAAVVMTAVRLATTPPHRRARGAGRRSPPRPETRRRDPDYATLPGGDSVEEAAEVPPERARELAD